jgi:hypothetical protein
MTILTSQEFASLAEIAKGPLATPGIPPEYEARLMELGLITEKTAHEFYLTEAGEMLWRQGRE